MKTMLRTLISLVFCFCLAFPVAGLKAADTSESLVTGNNQFAFDLYARLAGKEGNLFLSPYSISSALSMTYAGARGNTEKEMAKVLHFNLRQDRLHPAFQTLNESINRGAGQKTYQLTVANAIWAQKDCKFLPDFLKIARKNYDAEVENLDFAKNAEGARDTINRWVEKKTKDKIKDLIPSGILNALTRMVLTNAIYFKGNWARQFKKENTQSDTFYADGKTQIQALLMHQQDEFDYFANETLQVLRLPYQGDDLSMVVLLPRKNDGLPALEKKLTAQAV